MGHDLMIHKALEENDEVIVCVCGYHDDRGIDFIPFEDRISLVKDTFENPENYTYQEKIKVISVDDHAIGLSGKFDIPSWKIWSKELFKNAGLDPNDTDIHFSWYAGEKDYISKLKQIYPRHYFIQLNRATHPISGTHIRENPEKYRDYIYRTFQRYLIGKKILSPPKNMIAIKITKS